MIKSNRAVESYENMDYEPDSQLAESQSYSRKSTQQKFIDNLIETNQ